MSQDRDNDATPDLRQEIGRLSAETAETPNGKRKPAAGTERAPSRHEAAAGRVPSVADVVTGAQPFQGASGATPARNRARDDVPAPSIGDVLGEIGAEGRKSGTGAPRKAVPGAARADTDEANTIGSLSREAFAEAEPSPGAARRPARDRDAPAAPELREMLADLDTGAPGPTRASPRFSLRAWLFAPRRRTASMVTLTLLALLLFGGGGWWLATRPSALQAEMLELAERVDAYRDEKGEWPEPLTRAVELEAPLVLGDIMRWEEQRPGEAVLVYGLSSDGIRYTLIARAADEGWILALENRSFRPLPREAR